MCPAKPKLALSPHECDGCGRCVRACPERALKVGSGYIYVDWAACDACLACVDACDREAIVPKTPPAHEPAPARAPRASAAAVRAPASARTGGPRGRWGRPEALAVLSLTLVLFFVNAAVFGSEVVRSLEVRQLVAVRALVLGGYYATQLALLAYLARRSGLGFARTFRLDTAGATLAGAAAAAGVVIGLLLLTRVGSTGYGALAQALGWDPPARWNSSLTDVFGPDALGLVLSICTVVLIGPFVEELAFRGVVFDALSERGPLTAILGSAAVFAVAHLALWTLVPTALLGVALGWLAHTRKTLWPSIALHALYNGAAVAAAFYLSGR